MPALVLFSSLDGFEFLALDLICLLYGLGNMSVSRYSLDLRHVLVSLFQSIVVFQLLPLGERLHSLPGRCYSSPETNVAVVTSGKNKVVV